MAKEEGNLTVKVLLDYDTFKNMEQHKFSGTSQRGEGDPPAGPAAVTASEKVGQGNMETTKTPLQEQHDMRQKLVQEELDNAGPISNIGTSHPDSGETRPVFNKDKEKNTQGGGDGVSPAVERPKVAPLNSLVINSKKRQSQNLIKKMGVVSRDSNVSWDGTVYELNNFRKLLRGALSKSRVVISQERDFYSSIFKKNLSRSITNKYKLACYTPYISSKSSQWWKVL